VNGNWRFFWDDVQLYQHEYISFVPTLEALITHSNEATRGSSKGCKRSWNYGKKEDIQRDVKDHGTTVRKKSS
jgi:hypothetical protein